MAYIKTEWATGDAITAANLNKIELELQRQDGADGTNLQAAKDYADGKGAAALTDAKGYADEKDAAGLQSAKDYADGLLSALGLSVSDGKINITYEEA